MSFIFVKVAFFRVKSKQLFTQYERISPWETVWKRISSSYGHRNRLMGNGRNGHFRKHDPSILLICIDKQRATNLPKSHFRKSSDQMRLRPGLRKWFRGRIIWFDSLFADNQPDPTSCHFRKCFQGSWLERSIHFTFPPLLQCTSLWELEAVFLHAPHVKDGVFGIFPEQRTGKASLAATLMHARAACRKWMYKSSLSMRTPPLCRFSVQVFPYRRENRQFPKDLNRKTAPQPGNDVQAWLVHLAKSPDLYPKSFF